MLLLLQSNHSLNYTNKEVHGTTWVYSNDCQSEAAISGDFPKAASVFSSSALRTGGILHCRSPRITTTGVHWGCSQSAKRAFSLWDLNTKQERYFIYFSRLFLFCFIRKALAKLPILVSNSNNSSHPPDVASWTDVNIGTHYQFWLSSAIHRSSYIHLIHTKTKRVHHLA